MTESAAASVCCGHGRPLRALVGKAAPKEGPTWQEADQAHQPRIFRRSANKAPAPQPKTTKQDQVLVLLRRQDGTSIEEIVAATDGQSHSARGFLSGSVKKRLKIAVNSDKGEDGVRRYYVAAVKS